MKEIQPEPMDLQWCEGASVSCNHVLWVLFDKSQGICPYKALIHAPGWHEEGYCEPAWHAEGYCELWDESEQTWTAVHVPEHLTDDEKKALVAVEYRLLNSAGGA